MNSDTGETNTLHLACATPDAGWLIAVDCSGPFIGSFGSAASGIKAVSQTFGPARRTMGYVE